MPEEKAAERRPEAKEGGREEEENRLRISTEPIALGRPLSKKKWKQMSPKHCEAAATQRFLQNRCVTLNISETLKTVL
jgi:hypothetical protein